MDTPGRLELCSVSRAAMWEAYLALVDHDFYHSAAYHRFSEEQGEGQAFLAVYQEGAGRLLLWPYLLRPVEGLAIDGYFDVTSAYGYPGPLGRGCAGDEAFLTRASRALVDLWTSQGAVAAFTRFHPLLENHCLAPPSAPPQRAGRTVSIDLTRTPEQVWGGYQSSLRNCINKARRNGVRIEADLRPEHLQRFACLYRDTMVRNQASDYYFFGEEYFQSLLRHLGPRARLMIARWQDQVIGAGIFVEWNGILHNHFCVNDGRFLHLTPSKVLLDEVRLGGQQQGCRRFHLGGGRGGQTDSLFAFKAAYSKRSHDFYVWKKVLQPAVYEHLCDVHSRLSSRGRDATANGYFPAYRETIASAGGVKPTAASVTPLQSLGKLTFPGARADSQAPRRDG